jgi:CRISPR-associated protein Cas4
MNEENYITPIHIRDYLFCPSLFYYKHIMGINEPTTESMEEGTREFTKDLERWEERKTLLNKKRIHVDKMLFNQTLVSSKYKVRGIVDTVFWSNNKLHILEIKTSESEKLFPDHLYQTAVYALIAEDVFREPVYKIIVFYKKSEKWFEKRFTYQLRHYTIRLIDKINKIIDLGDVPEHKWKNKCNSCFYRNLCHG